MNKLSAKNGQANNQRNLEKEKSLEIEKLLVIQKNNMIRLYGADFSESLPARRQFKENMKQISKSQKVRH